MSAPYKTGNVVLSHRERDNNYIWVLAQLCPDWRVIECKDAIQWIVQRRDGESAGRARWAGRHYTMEREALLLCCRASCARPDPAALAVLQSLPDNHRGTHGQA